MLDFLAIAAADVAEHRASAAPTGCSTRPARTACRRSSPTSPGVDSGLMIAQYTQAGIVTELKRLAVPASVGLDPVLGDAGGPRLDGLARRRASCAGPSTGCAGCSPIELLTAARALDLRAPLRTGAGHRGGRDAVLRQRAPAPGPTATSHPEIDAVVDLCARRDRGAADHV